MFFGESIEKDESSILNCMVIKAALSFLEDGQQSTLVGCSALIVFT